MVNLSNNAEGGSDEVTVTTANSGGASGDAWDAVTIGTGATVVYDTAQSAHGGVAYRMSTGATAVTVVLGFVASHGSVTRSFGRAYIRLSATGVLRHVTRLRLAAALSARIQVSAADQVQLVNGAGSTVATSTATLAADTWYRIEWDITPGTSQSGEVKLFTGDSTSATETISAVSTYGTGIDEVRFGHFTNAANLAAMWFDDLNANDVAYPGSAGGGATVTPAVIAATAALPQPAANVQAGPAVAAVTAAVVRPDANVVAGPAVTAATAALPRPDVNVAAGSAVLPVLVVLPQAVASTGTNVTATPAVVPSVATVPQATLSVGAGPGTVPIVVSMPQVSAGEPSPAPTLFVIRSGMVLA